MTKAREFFAANATETNKPTIWDVREKMSQKAVVDNFGDGTVHVDEVALAKNKDGQEYAVVHIKEAPGCYINTGKVMSDTVKGLIEMYGNVDLLNEDIKRDPLEMKVSVSISTKSGREYFKWAPAWL